jgi:hypothetical protein
MIRIDARQLQKYGQKMIKRQSQVSGIIRSTINDQAFAVRTAAIKTTIPKNFNTRNSWISTSIMVDKAAGSKLMAETGAKKRWAKNSAFDFEGMKEQEKGSTLVNPQISSLFARGGAFSKNVKSGYRRSNLGRLRRVNSITQIRNADLAGNKAPMEIRGIQGISSSIKDGIYIFDTKKTGTRGRKIRRLKMVSDLSKKRVRLKKRAWLSQAVKIAVNQNNTFQSFKKNYNKYIK